jgi:hypothetical protein
MASAGSPDFPGNRLVLLGDELGSGSIAFYAGQHRIRYLAIGPLRTVLIKDVEQHEFRASTRSRFPSHKKDHHLFGSATEKDGVSSSSPISMECLA